MTAEELDEWRVDFLRFCARFADVFGRKEPRAQAAKYLRGLMSSVPRKNSWQVAEVVGDRIPDAMQRLLYKSKWSADAARDRLQIRIAAIALDLLRVRVHGEHVVATVPQPPVHDVGPVVLGMSGHAGDGHEQSQHGRQGNQ